jgi:hypothetical protein
MFASRSYYRFALIAAVAAVLAALAPVGGNAAPKTPYVPVPFAQGGPDSFGYKFVDSQELGGPQFNGLWEDISASGNLVFGAQVDDSVSPAINIGFTFSFYGTDYTTCYVTSNGNIHFTGPTANYPGQPIPGAGAPNAMIAAFWADLHTGPDGNIRSSSNATRFIVQWTSCEYYPSDNAENFNFQIRIEPSGAIYILYSTMSANGGSNSTAIGIENASGSVGLQYCYNGSPNVIAANRVIKFADNTDPNPPSGLLQAADAAGPAKPPGFVSDPTVYFRGTVTDPDAGNLVGVRVEILPSNVAFDPVNVTGQTASTPIASMVPSGQAAECVYTFTGVPFGSGDYHWRLQGIDNNGGGSTWVVFSAAPVHFTVDLDPPSVPSPISPVEGAGVGVPPPAGDVLLQWTPSTDVGPPGPISYRVRVSASPGFATTLADDVVTLPEHRVTLQIAAFPYFWQVAAIDQSGNQSAFFPAVSFLVIFDDGVNHGGGDCNISAGASPGNVLVVFAALAILAALFRRR